MKRVNSVLFALAFATPMSSIAFSGPFGLEMGMTVKELGSGFSEEQPGLYLSSTVPNPHSAFEAYVAKVGPKTGLCWIKAIGKDINANSYGTSLKSAFDDMRSRLSNTYGGSELFDVLLPGALWDDPDEYMMSLVQGERFLMASWDDSTDANLPENMTDLSLLASATNRSTGYLAIEYTFVNEAECEANINASEDSAL